MKPSARGCANGHGVRSTPRGLQLGQLRCSPKSPRLGAVKSRLARQLTLPADRVRLHRVLCERAMQNASCGWQRTMSPCLQHLMALDPFFLAQLAESRFGCQFGATSWSADLGERMHNALARLVTQYGVTSVLMGSDTSHSQWPAFIERAFGALETRMRHRARSRGRWRIRFDRCARYGSNGRCSTACNWGTEPRAN